jgi:hypothetical protein
MRKRLGDMEEFREEMRVVKVERGRGKAWLR